MTVNALVLSERHKKRGGTKKEDVRADCREIGEKLEDSECEWGVAKDYVRARMYFQLAADAGDKESKDLLPILDRIMTPEQIEEAHMLVSEWRARHPAIH